MVFTICGNAKSKIDTEKIIHEIKFDFKKYPAKREIVYQYHRNHHGSDHLQKHEIGIDLYDINGDGKDEVFVYLHSNNYCNPNGSCAFQIFESTGKDNYAPIILGGAQQHQIYLSNKTFVVSVLQSSTMHYHDILFSVPHHGSTAVWKWQKSGGYDLVDSIDKSNR